MEDKKRVAFSVKSVPDGKKYKVILNESNFQKLKVQKIKRNLGKVTGIDSRDQILCKNDVELHDEMTGADFDLDENTILLLSNRTLQSQQPTINFDDKQNPQQPTQEQINTAQAYDRAASTNEAGTPDAVPRVEQQMIQRESNNSTPASQTEEFHLQRDYTRRSSLPPQQQQIKRSSPALTPTTPPPSRRSPAPPYPASAASSPRTRATTPNPTPSSNRLGLGNLSLLSVVAPPNSWEAEREAILLRYSEDKMAMEREKEALRRKLNDDMLQRAAFWQEEKNEILRKWASEKKELLRKANEDREELMVENSRLRRELGLNFGTIDYSAFDEKRKVLSQRFNEADVLRQNAEKQLVEVQANLEKEKLEYQRTLDIANRNWSNEREELLRNWENEKQSLIKGFKNQSESKMREEIIREKAKWEQERAAILRNWAEESEVLSFIWKEGRESWTAEKTELMSKFQRDKEAYLQSNQQLTEELTVQIKQYESEIESLQEEVAQINEHLRVARQDASEHSLFVQSSQTALDELRRQIEKLLGGDVNLAQSLVEAATNKAIEQKKAENLQFENQLLRDQLRHESGIRRQLHNTLEDIKGNIRVIVRLRPLLTGESSNGISGRVEIRNETQVVVTTPSTGAKTFDFYRTFSDIATQEQLFEDVKALIQSAVDGYNVCFMAYGQTGSGKTFTIHGEGDKQRGVLPRAVEELFFVLQNNRLMHGNNSSFSIKCSMIELYVDTLIDLLDNDNSKKLELRQQPSGGMSVYGASEHTATSAVEVLQLLDTGNRMRQVHSTDMNEKSSRSHTIFTISLMIHSFNKKVTTVTKSKMLFVDLAGSERISKSHSTGDRFKEAQHINKSLSALGDVIAALSNKKQSFVPYRNSKLTLLLQDSIGGNSKTVMFANIAPGSEDISETLSTLAFASRVRRVQNAFTLNVSQIEKRGT